MFRTTAGRIWFSNQLIFLLRVRFKLLSFICLSKQVSKLKFLVFFSSHKPYYNVIAMLNNRNEKIQVKEKIEHSLIFLRATSYSPKQNMS